MKMRGYLLLLAIVMSSVMVFAQAAPARGQAPDLTTVLNRQLSNLENELVPLVEAMPDDKFDYRTTKEVRTFSEQARHAAATNYYYCSVVLGEKNPYAGADEDNGPAMKTKAEVVKFMKDSFAYAHKCFASINDKNATELVGPQQRATRLGLAISTIGHGFNHYGQMVQYARLNGVVPPASRPR